MMLYACWIQLEQMWALWEEIKIPASYFSRPQKEHLSTGFVIA